MAAVTLTLLNRLRLGTVRFMMPMLLALMVISCAAPPPVKTDFMKDNMVDRVEAPAEAEIQTPDFLPVTEDITPVKTRLVDLVTRNTPLGDILHSICEATGLNLLIGKGVSTDIPVTITLRNVTAEKALQTLFTSVDYFYSIRDNMLVVQATETKIIEIGHPAMVQAYSIEVGGDILGNATSSSSGSSGSGESGTLKGSVTHTGKNDPAAFNFWESFEKSISGLLNSDSSSAGAGTAGSIIVNRHAGTIAVTTSKRNMEIIERYVDSVKKSLNRQVLIEARIIEVELSDSLNFGIDWSFLDASGRIAGFGDLNIPTRSFNDIADQVIPNFRIGTSRGNFQALLTALKGQGEVNTLSNPRINVMNGQPALLSVGRNVSFISKVTSSTSTSAGSAPITTFNVETSSILSGVLIGLLPFINEKGEISITVTPIVSNLVELKEKSVGQIGNQTSLSLPTVDLKELSTTVKLRDRQMVIIGGLISKRNSTREERIPVLGDIPLLGSLFTRMNDENVRSELVVVLQPVLLRGEEF